MRLPFAQKGFSLIELMIVVMIIGILATIAIPNYQHYADRARFAEVVAAAAPFQLAVMLGLQEGVSMGELNTGMNGIPSSPGATRQLDSITVENGVITAMAASSLHQASYILSPNSDGTKWTVSGSCIALGLCHAA